MSEDVVSRLFIQRFINNFGAPAAPDPAELFAEYQRALAGTDDDFLREASTYVVDHHAFPQRWPTVAECKSAVEHIATERALTRQRRSWGKATGDEKWKEPSAESKARVEALMRQTLADLRSKGPPKSARSTPLADVSRPAWEARYGKAPQQSPVYPKNLPLDASGRPDVSHDAWHARYGYKGGEIDRRFRHEKPE